MKINDPDVVRMTSLKEGPLNFSFIRANGPGPNTFTRNEVASDFHQTAHHAIREPAKAISKIINYKSRTNGKGI